jgi:hypothetical protein
MRKAFRWIVPALLCVVFAAVALIIAGAVAGGSKRSSSNSTSAPAAALPVTTTTETSTAPPNAKWRRIATSGVPKSGRCGEITVNQHTSCAFARVVVKDYVANRSSSFQARSPVTGLTYAVHCKQAHGAVTCDDNSTSTLTFSTPTTAGSG